MVNPSQSEIQSESLARVPEGQKNHPYMARLQKEGYCDPIDLAGTSIWDLVPPPRTEFLCRVYARVVQIPPGETMTYAEVALSVGHPRAARAVGTAMARNQMALIIPCHRVVAQKGLGGYAYGLEIKEALLSMERGVVRKR